MSEAQVFARALYDALVGGALDALRTVSAQLEDTPGDGREQELIARIKAALPPSAPREVSNVLFALAREGMLDRLPEVISTFERYSQSELKPLSGEVISAVALDEAQHARITSELRTRYGERLDLRFKVDPALIGGLIIRIGDQVLDNSLRTRLSTIQRNMMAS